MENFKDKAFFSTTEVARLMGVSRTTIFRKVKNGLIQATRVGKTYLIPRGEVVKYLGDGELAKKQKKVARYLGEGELAENQKKKIEKGVDLVIRTYGKALKMLGSE